VRLRVALVRKPAAVHSHAPSTTHEGWAELRIVNAGFGTGRQEMGLERPNSRVVRVHVSTGYKSCRGKSAGVAKRPREREC
jgi:hypothetical protein